MKIKAIFFDIDGTLVPFGDHDVPAEVKKAINTMRSKGIKVFIATGRHGAWIDNLGDMEFDGYVTVNGGMCIAGDKQTIIYTHPIASDDISRLIAAYPGLNLEFSLVPADGDIFITAINKYVSDVCKLISVPPVPVRPIESIGNKDVVQLMAFGDKANWSDRTLYSTVLQDCEPTSWNPYFCDVIPRGSCKSAGIDKMIRHFGILPEETMAFGDGDNDISMIRYCKVGVAMGNASPDVKAAADYVTTDVTDHGIINALRHFGIIY